MPHRIIRYARRRLGRRGSMLTLLGASWIVIGIMVPLREEPDHLVLLNALEGARTVAWIVTGCIALWAARRREDRVGWLALYLMAAYRAIGYLAGAVSLVVEHGVSADLPTLADAVSRGATWAGFIAAIAICAGWREHPEELPTTAVIPTVSASQKEAK